MMLNICLPSQYMHHCVNLLCEVHCVIVYQGLGIIVVFFVRYLKTCHSLCIARTSPPVKCFYKFTSGEQALTGHTDCHIIIIQAV